MKKCAICENEDQDDMLHSIRESFLAAGRSADTLSLAEKRLIQEQLGLGDIESVERLLDPTKTITSMADLSAATSEIPYGSTGFVFIFSVKGVC